MTGLLQSAQDKVLASPALLKMIFRHLPVKSQLACMRVSKSFFGPAATLIYYRLDIGLDSPPHALSDYRSKYIPPWLQDSDDTKFEVAGKTALLGSVQHVVIRSHSAECAPYAWSAIFSHRLQSVRVHATRGTDGRYAVCLGTASPGNTEARCAPLDFIPSTSIHTLILRGLAAPSAPQQGISYARLPTSLRKLVLVLETDAVLYIPSARETALSMRHLRPTIYDLVIVFHSPDPARPWAPARRKDRALAFRAYVKYLASLASVPTRLVTFVGLGRLDSRWTGLEGGEEAVQAQVEAMMRGKLGTVSHKGVKRVGRTKFQTMAEFMTTDEDVFDECERLLWAT